MKRLLLLTLLITGCGPGFQAIEPIYHDWFLLPYAELVYNNLNERGIHPRPLDSINLKVEQLPNNYNAICRTKGNERTIIFNSVWLNTYSDDDIEAIMLHEVGHCGLGIHHHYDAMLDFFRPKSIMHTYYWTGWFQYNKDYYYNELKEHL